ncbi:sensor domain-containing diguanylate cyclase [Trinickia acidisoli]|uniref:sensor domain-containing diguanylate cyclase n=1 Tax=Trinickia acidisoli TaxID=2767482 RepID=UPI001A8F387E|nr:diguanylate cyclase [Trinickia acidisoli]
MQTTDFDHGTAEPAGHSTDDTTLPPTHTECEAIARLARMHFSVAAALIATASAQGQRLLAADGKPCRLPPADLLSDSAGTDTPTLILVADTHQDSRFVVEGTATAQWPRFFVACALTSTDGRRLGTLCLFDETPRPFDNEQCEFLRELSTLAAHALERAGVEPAPCNRAPRFEGNAELVTLALTGSGTGLWDRNVVTGEIHYSPAWKAMLGYAPHELSNRVEDAYLRVHPDDLTYVKATMQAHFESKTDSYAVEHRIRCKDGSYKWICSRGKVVSRDRTGRAQRMVGTSTDITALRETAANLQRTIDLVTNLTNEVPGLVFQYRQSADGEAAIPYASDGICDIYELTPEDVFRSADAIESRIDPRDLARFRQSLRDSATHLTPWHLEYRVNLPQQGLRWRQGDARPQRMPDGGTLWHGFITDATEHKRIESELHELATIDHLTQLSNRRHFTMQSEAELARLRHDDGTAAMLMLDLDHFKALNDRWGHALGDRVLSHFARLLRIEARTNDLVGRIGGEEFAVVLPDATIDDAIAFARRVQRRIDEMPLIDGDQHVALTVSIGIDCMRSTDVGAYQALSRCDKALYLAKARGRNRIELYEEQSTDTA